MGGAGADLTVDESVSAVLESVHGKGKENNGKFVTVKVLGWEDHGLAWYDGGVVAW